MRDLALPSALDEARRQLLDREAVAKLSERYGCALFLGRIGQRGGAGPTFCYPSGMARQQCT